MTAGKAPVTAAARVHQAVERAKAETGLEDFGGDTWREGLEVLVRSAVMDGKFNDAGEHAFYTSLVQPLVNRLQIEDWYGRHPEIDEQEVHVELLGVGFPRTGSTALAFLLAEDPAFRNLRNWEAPRPCPPPGVSDHDDRTRLRAAEQLVAFGEHVAPRLRSMLPQSPTGPIEDHDLMALEFTAQTFLVAAHVPTYADWFAHHDMEPTYRYERRALKLLQWKAPPNVWRLKSPTHTLFLDAYEKVFPQARFVMTHRDVSKVLPSVADLYATMLRAGNPGIDPIYVGELNMEQWGIALDRLLAFRRDPVRDAKFFDMGFADLQADPVAQIRELYAWLGDELTAATVERMVAWRRDNPRDKHGSHEYDGAEFGITAAALAARFGRYRQRFGALL